MNQIVRFSFEHDHSVPNDVSVFCEKQRHSDILFDDQDGNSGLTDLINVGKDFENNLGSQCCTRFVQHQHLWIRHQPPADNQHLHFSTAQGSGKGFAACFQNREEFVYFFQILLDAMAVITDIGSCLLYTSPSPRDRTRSRMPSSA